MRMQQSLPIFTAVRLAKRHVCSVTRLLDYFSNIWPFATINFGQIALNIYERMLNILPNTEKSSNIAKDF